jgi:prolyl oligopeptidase
VDAQNALGQPLLAATPDFSRTQTRRRGDGLDNHGQDGASPRGLLQRTSLDAYRSKDPTWEPVLDFIRLSADGQVHGADQAADCLRPAYRRCLTSPSRGGAKAVEIREFDMAARQFRRCRTRGERARPQPPPESPRNRRAHRRDASSCTAASGC